MRGPQGLVGQLLAAQVAVIGIGALALVGTAAVVGPRLFAEHLARTGEDSPMVTEHATEAFASSFAIARIKEIVPIWKKEWYEDGSSWIGSELDYQIETGRISR